MSIALADLVGQLEENVPAQDGTPSADQYKQAIKDAVAAFSHRAGMVRRHTINVVSNTAAYDLPADFFKLIRLETIQGQFEKLLVTGTGLIPLSATLQEEHEITGLRITLDPTPTYNLARYLWYKAQHVLNDDAEYEHMTEDIAGIVLAKATGNAWRLVASRVAKRAGWKYQVGDVMIDKTNVDKALATWVADFDTEFEKRLKAYIGPEGMAG
jgi:hypothetical protein